MADKTFNLKFYCADEVEYDGDCTYLQAHLCDGMIGIMAGHSNMIAILETGEMRIVTPNEEIRYAVTDGLLMIRDGNVKVLAFSAEKPEEIDEKRAQHALEVAKMELKRQKSGLEYRQAQADLSRALNRLKVKKRGS